MPNSTDYHRKYYPPRKHLYRLRYDLNKERKKAEALIPKDYYKNYYKKWYQEESTSSEEDGCNK